MTENLRGILRHFIVLLAATFVLSIALPAQVMQGPTTIRYSVHHDVSLPLSVMAQHAPPFSVVEHEAEPLRLIPLPPGLTQLPEDPVRQSSASGLSPSLAVGLSFEGLGKGQYGFQSSYFPPDTNGAVGATQYVQWVNASFAVFDKATGNLLLGPVAGNTLWQGFGGNCETHNDGDPVVTYDKLANRWVMSQFSYSLPYLQCVAVSQTSDATGSWYRYSFSYGNDMFNDYPKMGVWPDAYYETFNMFNNHGTFVGSDACAYDRNKMLAGQAATQICFQQNSSVGGLLPADLDGTTPPPAGSPNYMLNFGANTLNLFKFHVDFTNPSNSTFTGPTVINVAAFNPLLCSNGPINVTCVPQPGTSQLLDSLADRLMHRLAYRNFGTHESLVVNHSVVAGSSGGVRWYEIQNPSGTPVVAQQSTYAPDSTYRWMGSVAMDQAGDLAVGYSKSSSSLYPSIAFAGRLATDPVNTLQAETLVVNGTGSQSINRWGDYSAMQVDPVDDCTFWYTQEYNKTSGLSWNTRIVNFKFSSCGGGPPPSFTLSDSPSSLTITQGGPGGTSSITVNPLNGFNGTVSLTATGLPSGVTASFNPPSTTTTSTLTLTANSTATTGTTTVTITGTSGSLVANTTLTLTVKPATQPDFTISASPSSVSVPRGGNGNSTITITSKNNFNSSTTLSATGLPSGVTATFSPNPVTPPVNGSATSTLTFTASPTATVGTSTVTVTGTSGSLVHSTTITLTITMSSGQIAIYNSTLMAPACATVGSSCDSGPSLLLGRDSMVGGAEPHQPNTIYNSCADGTGGSFHSDESNDRIVVASTSGGPLTHGTTATITATVWAYQQYSADALDLYYAADATHPSWVFIKTIVPTKGGGQNLSATFTLPTGSLQAVRAQFRYLGSASPCSTGPYNDHDDLIFAVQ